MSIRSSIIISIATAAVIFGGGGFYSGMEYIQSGAGGDNRFLGQGFGNMNSEERQQRFQDMGINPQVGREAPRSGGESARRSFGESGFVGGEILSRDDQSITVKLPDGGSKIVFFSESTVISKPADGSADDLRVGGQVTVNGKANSDGSVTAQNITVQ